LVPDTKFIFVWNKIHFLLISRIERDKTFLFQNPYSELLLLCLCDNLEANITPLEFSIWPCLFNPTFNVPSRNLQRIQTEIYYNTKISPGSLHNVEHKEPIGNHPTGHVGFPHGFPRFPESIKWTELCMRVYINVYV